MGSHVRPAARIEQPEGQATYEMANLRPARTGLKAVVFVSQRGGARHAARIKVSHAPELLPSQMASYALLPFRHEDGPPLDATNEAELALWVATNAQVLLEYWNGDIEYAEDLIDRIVPT
jgi:hypothetical protein